MITEDYCSYEVSKLLKGKGFNIPCLAHWHIGNDGHEKFSDYPFNWNEKVKNDLGWLSCPTHQMAMKWLREVHNLFICIELGVKAYVWTITNTTDYVVVYIDVTVGTYEEAVEAALKYSLKNLIL